MIKSLHIQNIQNHKNSKLLFHPGVNIIVGPSEHGKSAIMNSLYWAWQNRPLGDPHRNWGGGVMLSRVVLDNGIVEISRDKQTQYKITTQKGTKTLKAGGQNPPDEVTALFNMDRKINFQKQLEKDAPIFLLSESPGEVAAFFNKVAGLYKIDKTVSKGKADLRKTELQLNNIKEQIQDKEKDLSKYAGIDERYTKVCTYTQTLEKHENSTRILNNTGLMLYEIRKLEKLNEVLQKRMQLKDAFGKAIVLKNKIRDSLVYVQEINEKNNTINGVTKQNRLLGHRLKIKEKVDALSDIVIEQKKKTGFMSTLEEVILHISGTSRAVDHLQEDKEELQEQFHELMPNVCPLCDQEVK